MEFCGQYVSRVPYWAQSTQCVAKAQLGPNPGICDPRTVLCGSTSQAQGGKCWPSQRFMECPTGHSKQGWLTGTCAAATASTVLAHRKLPGSHCLDSAGSQEAAWQPLPRRCWLTGSCLAATASTVLAHRKLPGSHCLDGAGSQEAAWQPLPRRCWLTGSCLAATASTVLAVLRSE
jgi:hypothetical protein